MKLPLFKPNLNKDLPSMAKLVMVEEEEGKPTKVAHSMVAKDGEVTACPASL